MRHPELFRRELTAAQWAGAVAVSAVALLLRVWRIGRQGLFIDEFADLHDAGKPLAGVWRVPDGFPPLFVTAAHFWIRVFGSIESVRYLALLAGLVAVGLCAAGGWLIGGSRGAFAAGGLAAVNPLLVQYSQEARPYALVVPIVAGLVVATLALLQGGTRRVWWVFTLAAVGAMWVHYFLWFVVALVVVAVFVARPTDRRRLGVAVVVMVAMTLPLLGVLRSDLDLQTNLGTMGGTARFGPGALVYTALTFFGGFSLGPSVRELHELSSRQAARLAVVPLALIAPLVIGLGLWVGRRLKRPQLALLAGLGTVAVALVGALSGATGTGFRPRYVSWGVVPLVILAGIALARAKAVVAVLAPALIVVVSLFATVNRQTVGRYQNEDIRGAVQYLATIDPDPGHAAVVVSGYLEPLAGYYNDIGRTLIRIDEEGKGASITDGTWLIYSRGFHDDAAGAWLSGLLADRRVTLQKVFAGVELYRVEPDG